MQVFKMNPAIVLAGGLGTRLRSVIQDLPKPMAPMGEKPFLHFVLAYLQQQGIREVILSVGYKHEIIESYFGEKYLGMRLQYSVEDTPLGTGGGLQKAFNLIQSEAAFVVNGDTFFEIDLAALQTFHATQNAHLTLSLKALTHFDRYGTVVLNSHGQVIKFEEKKYHASGLINGGIYVCQKDLFAQVNNRQPLPEKYSFETEIMEKQVAHFNFFGKELAGYFIDIGIPSDYELAIQKFTK